jgi:FtsP/CotA-like multicopper oxidase with cupredoxin domain
MARITRRDLLRLGVYTAGASLLGARELKGFPLFHDDLPRSPATIPFQRPLPIPPAPREVAPFTPTCTLPDVVEPCLNGHDPDPECAPGVTRYFEVEMKEQDVELIPGLTTRIWGYDGFFPGPTFSVNKGERLVVRQTNNLPEFTSVHLHGGHTPAESDGHPILVIPPSGFRDYCYPNCHRAATQWYHDHADRVTGHNVYMGLAGFYIVHDQNELSLGLPSGDQDVAMVFQDRRFFPDGSLFYDPFDHDGFLGDKFLVNGAIQPFFEVSRRKYRFRFLNGSNARYYELFLSSGQPFVQIATDGALLPAPLVRRSIRLAMAERVEVVVDFSQYPVGTSLTLDNCLIQEDGRGPKEVNRRRCTPLVRFDVVSNAVDDSVVPDLLLDVPVQVDLPPVRTRRFDFERRNGAWAINGKFFDGGVRVDADPRLCTSEVWVLRNKSGGWEHPIHIHHEDFVILRRNGRRPPLHERGFKDTVNLGPNDEVRVHIPFVTFTGKYVFHCHNLEHEDMEMMGQFEVLP